MRNIEEIENKPTHLSTDKDWMTWFDDLKKDFKKNERRRLFKTHWKQSDAWISLANTNVLRDYLQDNGLTVFKNKNI